MREHTRSGQPQWENKEAHDAENNIDVLPVDGEPNSVTEYKKSRAVGEIKFWRILSGENNALQDRMNCTSRGYKRCLTQEFGMVKTPLRGKRLDRSKLREKDILKKKKKNPPRPREGGARNIEICLKKLSGHPKSEQGTMSDSCEISFFLPADHR